MRHRPPIQRLAPLLLTLALLDASTGLPSEAAQDTPRACAEAFGAALRSGDASRLAPLLPRRGRVRLRLVRLGSDQGSFSAGQVQALFEDFFKKGSVRSFTLIEPRDPVEVYALIRARTEVVDRRGMPDTVDLHLIVELEEQRWILREIGEAQR